MNKESALELLNEYITTKSLLNHSQMVAIAMQAYAQNYKKMRTALINGGYAVYYMTLIGKHIPMNIPITLLSTFFLSLIYRMKYSMQYWLMHPEEQE